MRETETDRKRDRQKDTQRERQREGDRDTERETQRHTQRQRDRGKTEGKKDKMKNLDTGFRCWFLGFVVMIVSNLFIAFLLPKAVAGNEESVQEIIQAAPWVSLISTGLLAPFIEEMTFRKAFRNMISNDRLFILISGIIFGGLHVVLSLNSYYDLAYLIPYCSLGIAFGFAYVKTKTVFTSFVMHTLHNTALTLISIASTLVFLC